MAEDLAALHRNRDRGVGPARGMFESNFPVDNASAVMPSYGTPSSGITSGASAARRKHCIADATRVYRSICREKLCRGFDALSLRGCEDTAGNRIAGGIAGGGP